MKINYFILKALFVFKIFKFLRWLFGHAEKWLDYKSKVIFNVRGVTGWLTNIVVSAFQYAIKNVSHFFHVSFLETRKSYGLCPAGLNIRKKPFIEFKTSDLKVFWNETIKRSEENLLEALCTGVCERLFTIEKKFWAELRYFEKEQESEDLKEWLVKLIVHLEREVERIIRKNRKKIKKLCTDETSKQLVDERFLEHSNLFTFFTELKNFFLQTF